MQAKSFKFNFRQRTVRDENGAELGKAPKNPPVELDLPVPTTDELIAFLQSADSKEAQLILDAVAAVIGAEAKAQLDDVIEGFGDSEGFATAQHIDFAKLDLSYIANLPPATRTRGPQITDEDWNAFFEDYKAVIIPATGKPEAKINNHIAAFKKPTAYKARKDILGALLEHLDIYCSKAANLEDTAACVAKLQGRFNKWMQVEEPALTDAF